MPRVQASPGTGMTHDRVFTGKFFLVCFTNSLEFMTVYALLITLPVFAVTRLGAPEGLAGLVTATVSIASILALPYLGHLVDRFGRTPFMRLGLAVLLAETLALHFVSWLPLLVVIGMLTGGAMASFQIGATTLVADLAPAHRRGEAMGIFGTFSTTAMALAPAVSTFVMLNSGFTAVFALSSALAGVGLVLSLLVREPVGRTEISSHGPFLARAALLSGVCIFSITLTYGALVSFLPGYAPKIGLGNVGLFFTVFAISSLLVRFLAGTLSDRIGRVPVIIPALFLTAVGMALLAQTDSPVMVLVAAALYGLGYGCTHPTAMALAVDLAGPGQRASGIATFSISYNVGIVVGSLGMGYLLAMTSFKVMAAIAGAAPLLAMALLYLRRQSAPAPGR